jgi:hypothetical protein
LRRFFVFWRIMLSPANDAPKVTNEVAYCMVCKTQRQVKGDSDKEGCPFCHASREAITIINEEYDNGRRNPGG